MSSVECVVRSFEFCVSEEGGESRRGRWESLGFRAVGIIELLSGSSSRVIGLGGGPVQESHLLCEAVWTFEPSVSSSWNIELLSEFGCDWVKRRQVYVVGVLCGLCGFRHFILILWAWSWASINFKQLGY